jgi:putative endonuclease
LSWIVYMLACADKRLYTGITKNLDRRLAEHAAGKGANIPKAVGLSGWCTVKPARARQRHPGAKPR